MHLTSIKHTIEFSRDQTEAMRRDHKMNEIHEKKQRKTYKEKAKHKPANHALVEFEFNNEMLAIGDDKTVSRAVLIWMIVQKMTKFRKKKNKKVQKDEKHEKHRSRKSYNTCDNERKCGKLTFNTQVRHYSSISTRDSEFWKLMSDITVHICPHSEVFHWFMINRYILQEHTNFVSPDQLSRAALQARENKAHEGGGCINVWTVTCQICCSTCVFLFVQVFFARAKAREREAIKSIELHRYHHLHVYHVHSSWWR